jgi:hypothetical protein
MTHSNFAFQRLWLEHYCHAQPIGWSLRISHKEEWIRFYSLPDGKRYATEEPEFTELLDRYNGLADEILTGSARCWIIAALPVHDGFSRFKPYDILSRGFKLLKEEQISDADGDVERYEFFIKEDQWVAQRHNLILIDIARDRLPPLLFISEDNGMFLHPTMVERM